MVLVLLGAGHRAEPVLVKPREAPGLGVSVSPVVQIKKVRWRGGATHEATWPVTGRVLLSVILYKNPQRRQLPPLG